MSIKFTKYISIFGIAIASLLAGEVAAENEPDATPISINEAFERAYFERSGNAFESLKFQQQLNFFFGFNGFPETNIIKSGENLDNLYKEVIQLQTQSGPVLRTRDLSNPYGTSLLDNPTYLGY